MDVATTLANELLQRALGNAAVESFGLAHQIPYLEFRDDRAQDHVLTIQTSITSNVVWAAALASVKSLVQKLSESLPDVALTR